MDARAAAPDGGPHDWLSGGLHVVVVALPLGRVGNRRVVVGRSGALLALGSGVAPIRTCGAELVTPVLKTSCGTGRGSFRVKALRFGADDGDACGHRFLLKDVVVVLLFVPGFWVKTLVPYGLGSGDALRRFSF